MDRSGRKNQELKSALRSVIGVLDDSQKSMAEIGERLQDPALRRYFLTESLRRANFRAELENILHRHGVADVNQSGTATGAVYRIWARLESSLGAGDEAMLETVEQAEDETRDAYRAALNAGLPLPIRQLLTAQQTHILTTGDFVRAQREAEKVEKAA